VEPPVAPKPVLPSPSSSASGAPMVSSSIAEPKTGPSDLTCATYVDPKAADLIRRNGPHVYELYGVLVHSGSALGGHYYAYIRDLDNPHPSGAWYNFNDSSVSSIDVEEVSLPFDAKSCM
jgi:ubiquitin C-terminal hydrolase